MVPHLKSYNPDKYIPLLGCLVLSTYPYLDTFPYLTYYFSQNSYPLFGRPLFSLRSTFPQRLILLDYLPLLGYLPLLDNSPSLTY